MNLGKTLFAQIMEFVPWTSFARIVAHYGGNSGVRSLNCTEQFRAMSFAQLTYRESLRDIEICLLANQKKLYGMGFRSPVKRSTLADANEGRDWHIWEDLATVLIRRVRANCIATRVLVSISPIRSTPWMPRPSTCACRFSHGRRFVPPRRPSSCIRFWICAATSRLSSTSRTARWAMSMCWICCPSRQVRST